MADADCGGNVVYWVPEYGRRGKCGSNPCDKSGDNVEVGLSCASIDEGIDFVLPIVYAYYYQSFEQR